MHKNTDSSVICDVAVAPVDSSYGVRTKLILKSTVLLLHLSSLGLYQLYFP